MVFWILEPWPDKQTSKRKKRKRSLEFIIYPKILLEKQVVDKTLRAGSFFQNVVSLGLFTRMTGS